MVEGREYKIDGRRVFVGVPMHGGTMSAGTTHSLVSAASTTGKIIQYQALGLSLLARNFNTLFCNAYTKGFDYFFLLHADVSASPRISGRGSWIDCMLDLMRDSRAAAISVVIPIKSEEGQTSFGLDLYRDNEYTLRRVTMQQLAQLPNDFIGHEDVCELFNRPPDEAGAMLINTGCLGIDLRNFPWQRDKWPGFGIDDFIGWSASGVPRPFTQPEDWRFSRWLFKHNYPYYATKAIHIDHFGAKVFPNCGTWGVASDETVLEPAPDVWASTL